MNPLDSGKGWMKMAEEFSLAELAAEWGRLHPGDPIASRTLRYYIAEDLLEGPGRVGPGRHYGGQHLRHLEAVRLMQQNRHTIDEIRSLLKDIAPDRLGEVIQEQRHILDARKGMREWLQEPTPETEEVEPGPSSRPSPESPLVRAPAGRSFAGLFKTRKAALPDEESRWIRVSLLPGIEVLIRDDVATQRRDNIRKWLEDGLAHLSPNQNGEGAK